MRKRVLHWMSVAVMALSAGGVQAQDAAVDTIPVQDGDSPAEGAATGLPYTFVSGRYLYTDYDDADVGQDGFGIEGSFLLGTNVYLVGGLFSAETEEFDHPFFGPDTTVKQTQIDIGAGYRHALSPTMDVNASVRVVQLDVEIDNLSDDDMGFQAGIGLRAIVAPAVEVRGEISYLDVFESSETHLNLSGLYRFTPNLAAGLDAVLGDDSKSYGATVRYGF